MASLRTDRLLLRQWRDGDLRPWVSMNADPEVHEFSPSVLSQDQAADTINHYREDIDKHGWGWWAIEERATGLLAGMTGLGEIDERLPVHGVEAGWRLARWAWGMGYATEAARAVVAYGFSRLHLPEILAMAAAGNVRSHAVMRRLGMTHDPADDFDDPTVPPGPLRHQILFRLRNPGLTA